MGLLNDMCQIYLMCQINHMCVTFGTREYSILHVWHDILDLFPDRQHGVWPWRYQSPVSADVDGAEAFLHPHDNGRGVGDARHQVWSLFIFFLPPFTLILSGFITASFLAICALLGQGHSNSSYFLGFLLKIVIFLRNQSHFLNRSIEILRFFSNQGFVSLTTGLGNSLLLEASESEK